MSTSLRFWRWRRNPLKRSTDRTETWARLAAGLLLVIGAPTAGVATGLGVIAHAPRPPAEWHQVSAVLTRRAPPPITGVGAGPRQVRATVQWHAAPGREHTGEALVPADSPSGSRTTIWLDRAGNLRDDPTDPQRTRSAAIVYGTLAASGTTLFAGSGWALVRTLIYRRRAADLDREWEQVGPDWGRHHI